MLQYFILKLENNWRKIFKSLPKQIIFVVKKFIPWFFLKTSIVCILLFFWRKTYISSRQTHGMCEFISKTLKHQNKKKFSARKSFFAINFWYGVIKFTRLFYGAEQTEQNFDRLIPLSKRHLYYFNFLQNTSSQRYTKKKRTNINFTNTVISLAIILNFS